LPENIDPTLVNSLYCLLNFKIGGSNCRVITEFRTGVHCIHMHHLFCNAFDYCNLFRSLRAIFVSKTKYPLGEALFTSWPWSQEYYNMLTDWHRVWLK